MSDDSARSELAKQLLEKLMMNNDAMNTSPHRLVKQAFDAADAFIAKLAEVTSKKT